MENLSKEQLTIINGGQETNYVLCNETAGCPEAYGVGQSSRQREFHPKPLTEPCLKVSPHTALVVQI